MCKILKEYGYEKDKERCINDLSALLCNKTTERKLIKKIKEELERRRQKILIEGDFQ